MDLLKQGAAWLAQQRRRHAASDVIYSRGAASVTVAATRGRSQFELSDADGVQTSYESRDFLITAADLTLDGVPITPEKGDRITPLVDDAPGEDVYEVLPPEGVPTFRFTDSFRQTIRVHTKLIEVSNA